MGRSGRIQFPCEMDVLRPFKMRWAFPIRDTDQPQFSLKYQTLTKYSSFNRCCCNCPPSVTDIEPVQYNCFSTQIIIHELYHSHIQRMCTLWKLYFEF